jgi:hypothetical protein
VTPEEEAAAAEAAQDERIAAIVKRVLAEGPAGATGPAVPAPPAPPASGGGQEVPANKMQDVATSVVRAVTEAAILAGRKEGAAAVVPPAPAAPAAPAKKRWSFFGEDE